MALTWARAPTSPTTLTHTADGCMLRHALAGLAFLAITAVLRLTLPRGRTLLHMALFGLLSIAGFHALMY